MTTAMKKMKTRRLFICTLCSMLSLMVLSCGSVKGATDVYVPVDYSQEAAVKSELELIARIAESNLVKALWRTKLLCIRMPDSAEAKKAFEEYGARCVDEINSLVAEKDFVNALRVYTSLQECGSSLSGVGQTVQSISDMVYKDVPKISSDPSKVPVGEMIKGTVTVFVDKGIKIKRGVGYADSVLGSGFFISKNGYIVTNHHVIADMVDKKYEGYSRLYIKLAEDPETRIPAKVVGYDSIIDLAILKAEIDAPYVFSLGSSRDLKVGDKVFAIGSPLGLENTLTSGIISSTDRRLFASGTVFQIDAAVNSGNSGGPMIDEHGRVQGVVFAGVPMYQGLNFAIPVEYLRNELPFLISGGERIHSWISVFGKTRRLPGSGAKNTGVQVIYVLPGGSADRAGIVEGDTIIGISRTEITSLEQLKNAFMQLPSDCVVPVKVQHADETVSERFVYLDHRPKAPGYEIYKRDIMENSMYPLTGMKLVNDSTLSKRKFQITEILKNSTADETGFSVHDPVEILNVDFTQEKEVMFVTLAAKKRKNGFLDVTMRLTAPMDSPNFF